MTQQTNTTVASTTTLTALTYTIWRLRISRTPPPHALQYTILIYASCLNISCRQLPKPKRTIVYIFLLSNQIYIYVCQFYDDYEVLEFGECIDLNIYYISTNLNYIITYNFCYVDSYQTQKIALQNRLDVNLLQNVMFYSLSWRHILVLWDAIYKCYVLLHNKSYHRDKFLESLSINFTLIIFLK